MKCPHCGNDLEVNNAAEWNVEAYGNTVLAVTLCCGKGVYLVPVRTYVVEAYDGARDDDNWDNLFKTD